MLKDNSQLKLSLSPYQGIYEAIIPANHLLRRIKKNIDFSFVNPMLRKQYCEHFGRPAKEPEMMFKLLFLKKPSLEAGLEEEIAYTKKLLQALEEGRAVCGNQKIQETAKKMNELLENEQIREIRSKDDKDARFGHKTATSTFYGYKNHIAMTEDRLITGISVTHGGAPDGQELPGLIEKTQINGIKVTEVIGDMAYVSDDNLETCGKEITLIARTNTAVAAAANGRMEEGFCFNKDAGMLQCPAGELATRVEKRAASNGNTYLRYVFSKVKCRKCPLRETCRVGKSKSKERSYSITQASHRNQERLEFEGSEMFKERMKIRHRIEEKNGELKEAHGLRRADSRGLFAMRLQMYLSYNVVFSLMMGKKHDIFHNI